MNIPCPTCREPIVPGMHQCETCGTNLLREAVPGSTEPVCAVHPQWVSLGACGRCGSFACASCLRQGEQGEPVCAACEAREPMDLLAWDRRDDLGTLKAYWETCLDLMFRPGPTLERMRPHGSMTGSLLFAMMSSLAAYLTTLLFYAAMTAIFPLPDTVRNDNVSPAALRTFGVGMFLGAILLMPVMGLFATLFSSALDHVLLKLAGSERPLEVTVRANALSQAPLLLGLIPLCGIYVAPFWVLGLRVVTYRSLHRVSWGAAVFGALGMPLGLCCLCGGFYALAAAAAGR